MTLGSNDDGDDKEEIISSLANLDFLKVILGKCLCPQNKGYERKKQT